MSFDDLDRPKAKPVQRDLTLLGVAELRDYIAELQQEIARTEAEISKKEKDKASAEALFRKP
jgi:uncharacterized small protein (DUF1192 family)